MTETKRGPGRPKGSKNKPKPDVIQGGGAKLKGPGTAGPRHNKPPALTDEQRKAHFLATLAEYERSLEALEEKKAAVRNLLKRAKAEGVGKKDLDEARRLKKTEVEELAVEARRRAEIAAWTGVGIQLDLLDTTDRRSADEKAAEEGFTAGARGDGPKTAYTGEAHQAFMAGYHRGVAARDEAKARITGEELANADPMIDCTFAERAAEARPEARPEAPSTTEMLADRAPPLSMEEAEAAFCEAIEDAED